VSRNRTRDHPRERPLSPVRHSRANTAKASPRFGQNTRAARLEHRQDLTEPPSVCSLNREIDAPPDGTVHTAL